LNCPPIVRHHLTIGGLFFVLEKGKARSSVKKARRSQKMPRRDYKTYKRFKKNQTLGPNIRVKISKSEIIAEFPTKNTRLGATKRKGNGRAISF
jgi:hypothetical protein